MLREVHDILGVHHSCDVDTGIQEHSDTYDYSQSLTWWLGLCVLWLSWAATTVRNCKTHVYADKLHAAMHAHSYSADLL